jgi:heme A synthase
MGSNPPRDISAYVYSVLCCLLQVAALRRADHPSKESYVMFIIIIIIIIIIIMALQPFVGPWPLFQFLHPIHGR